MRKATSSTQLAAFLFVDSRWHEPHDAVQCCDHGSTFEFLFKFQTEFFSNFLFEFQVVRESNRSTFEGPLYLDVVGLEHLNNALNCSNHTISEQWGENDVRSRSGVMWDTVPAHSWSDWGRPQKCHSAQPVSGPRCVYGVSLTLCTGGQDCPKMFSGHLVNTVMKLWVPCKRPFFSAPAKRILGCREGPWFTDFVSRSCKIKI
jgi:hypothetical protein